MAASTNHIGQDISEIVTSPLQRKLSTIYGKEKTVQNFDNELLN